MASESIASTSPPAAESVAEHSLPPIAEIAVATLVLVVAGGIYLASNIPGKVSLAPAIVLLGLAVALLLTNAVLLSRVKSFAWRRFSVVFRWVLLSYVVIAGMLEYVFVYDHVQGGTLIVLSGMLLVFGLNVPLVISFTVARYAEPD